MALLAVVVEWNFVLHSIDITPCTFSGQSGLGKSTFVNSLFLTDFYNSKGNQTRSPPFGVAVGGKTLQINEHSVRLNESGVALTLTLIDTPGFGDAVDNSQW